MALNARHFRFFHSIGNIAPFVSKGLEIAPLAAPCARFSFVYKNPLVATPTQYSAHRSLFLRWPIRYQGSQSACRFTRNDSSIPTPPVALEPEKTARADSSLQNTKIPLKIAFLLLSCYYILNRKRCQWFVQYVNTLCGFL